MEQRVEIVENRLAGVELGLGNLEKEVASVKDLMVEALNSMRNQRRTEERGKNVVDTLCQLYSIHLDGK